MFVASRIDYCNTVLAGAPKATTNKLQRVLNAAARVVSGTHKFDRGLSRLSIPSYIGSMFLSESCTNSASWCSTACAVKRLSTSWNCASQSHVSHRGNIFDPPPDSSWSYRVTRSAFTADEFSVWLARWSVDSLRNPVLAGTVLDNL